MANAIFNYSTYIQTTPERLWEALTSETFTRQYWGGRTMESDWKEGSTINIVQPQGTEHAVKIGKVVKSDPPKLLSYMTDHEHPEASSTMTFEIVQMIPGQVRLNIIHEVSGDQIPPMIREGWFAIAASLKTLLETGKPLDYSWWRG